MLTRSPATQMLDTDPFVLAERADRIRPSMILELMKLMGHQPGLIALGGGLPSPDTFPVEALRAASDRVLSHSGRSALQYASTEGYGPLRDWVAEHLRCRGIQITSEQVLITNGSQQGLDLLGRLLMEPGTPVAVESPTYLGALQAFEPCGAPTLSLVCDDEGPLPDHMPGPAQARALYVLPTFQNPSGRSMGLLRREAVVARAQAARLPVLEDDPYADLWYDEAPPAALASLWPQGSVYLGSFSKVLAPGLRLGYVVAPTALLQRLTQAKQAADMHTSGYTQQIVHELLSTGMLPAHLQAVRARYRLHRDAMQAALSTHFQGLADWVTPRGGMFFWLKLKADIDTTSLLPIAIARGVAYLPGRTFFASAPQRQTLRLSFVTEDPVRIATGVEALATVMREAVAA